MPIPLAALAAAILLAVASAPPAAAQTHGVEIAEYGLFDTRETGSRTAPETTKGSIYNISDYRLIRRTTCIRARLGVEFGVTLRDVAADPSGLVVQPVRVEIHHPSFTAEGGNGRMVEAWPMSLVGTPLYSGWTFEAPYEIVTGRWTIDVIRDGQLLARQGFDIVGPDEGCPAVQSQGGTFFDGSGKAMDNFRNILAGGFVQH